MTIERRGKFIIFYLSNYMGLVIHLGMSGRLRLIKSSKYKKEKHDHLIISTNKEHFLVFNDPRKFGFVDFDIINDLLSRKYLLNLGIEALSSKLNADYLFSKISKTTVPIKQILLDQRIIAGIGNIYASEILFNAKISPLESGKDLNRLQLIALASSTKKILKKAIKSGGSTLRNYVSTDGTLGSFQNKFRVYDREGFNINGNIIKKISQYGRSTYFCPKIQIKN